MIRLLLLPLLALLATPVSGEGFPQIDRARTLLNDAEIALNRAKVRPKSDQLAAIGQAVRAHETALSALRQGLRAMSQERQSLGIGLEQDQAQLAELLGAMQSVAMAPRSALLVFPGGPLDAARAQILMAEITPRLDRKMADVKTRLDELSALQSQQDAARVEARGALASLQDLRVRTAQIMRSRTKKVDRAELAEQARAAGRQAKTLDDLASTLGRTLGRTPGAALTADRFAALQGALPLPVAAGAVQHIFGDSTAGRRAFGLSISAPAFAQVTAPLDATIRYAGPLIGYDKVLVLEPEAGWMLVLAGLQNTDRSIGEAVLAGEKLGDMGGPIPTSEEFLLSADNGDGQFARETLYIELRKGSTPVDPQPWFIVQE